MIFTNEIKDYLEKILEDLREEEEIDATFDAEIYNATLHDWVELFKEVSYQNYQFKIDSCRITEKIDSDTLSVFQDKLLEIPFGGFVLSCILELEEFMSFFFFPIPLESWSDLECILNFLALLGKKIGKDVNICLCSGEKPFLVYSFEDDQYKINDIFGVLKK